MGKPTFIKLTGLDGRIIWVNMNYIWRICMSEEHGSRLYIHNSDSRQVVQETPEDILMMLSNQED